MYELPVLGQVAMSREVLTEFSHLSHFRLYCGDLIDCEGLLSEWVAPGPFNPPKCATF